LANLHTKLHAEPQYLTPNLLNTWTKQYQMLPGCMHTTSGSTGFVLHAIKMCMFLVILCDIS
ncbi:hypothetical protein K439DRAFT_1362460, partial [Ramaria rubella]